MMSSDGIRSSLQRVCRILTQACSIGWPYTVSSMTHLLRYGRRRFLTRWFRVAPVDFVGRWFAALLKSTGTLSSKLLRLRSPPDPSTWSPAYTPEEEKRYWATSARYLRILGASNANTTPPHVPLVTYYVPKLLPAYRSARHMDTEAAEYHLPARAFCKWHRMVFQGPLHPIPKQAESLIKSYSSRDRREIHRISRLLTDEDVFIGTVPWTSAYRDMWRHWLDTKGPDIAIVFS